jgi:hypothetical protein
MHVARRLFAWMHSFCPFLIACTVSSQLNQSIQKIPAETLLAGPIRSADDHPSSFSPVHHRHRMTPFASQISHPRFLVGQRTPNAVIRSAPIRSQHGVPFQRVRLKICLLVPNSRRQWLYKHLTSSLAPFAVSSSSPSSHSQLPGASSAISVG